MKRLFSFLCLVSTGFISSCSLGFTPSVSVVCTNTDPVVISSMPLYGSSGFYLETNNSVGSLPAKVEASRSSDGDALLRVSGGIKQDVSITVSRDLSVTHSALEVSDVRIRDESTSDSLRVYLDSVIEQAIVGKDSFAPDTGIYQLSNGPLSTVLSSWRSWKVSRKVESGSCRFDFSFGKNNVFVRIDDHERLAGFGYRTHDGLYADMRVFYDS